MNREEITERLLSILTDDNWEEKLRYLESLVKPKYEILWGAFGLSKDHPYLALKIADYYKDDPDPLKGGEIDLLVENEDETRVVTSVRGTLPYLLQGVLQSSDVELYPKVLDILDKLVTDDILYVRQQSCVTLDILAANRYATKKNDETPFNLSQQTRERIEEMVFSMLRDSRNKDNNRVIQYLIMPLNRLRRVSTEKAKEILEICFFKNNEFRPHYVTNGLVPLAMFFADFCSEKDFDNSYFQEYLKRIIKESPDDLRSTIIWHVWKNIEEFPETLVKFSKYFDLFFEKKGGGDEMIGQMDFLIRTVLEVDLDLGISLFERTLDYIHPENMEIKHGRPIYFHAAHENLDKISNQRPDKVHNIVHRLMAINNKGGYVGDIGNIKKYLVIDDRHEDS